MRHHPPHCPRCEYDLASLPGVPTQPDGVFEREVACPECGFTVPAGGRVIEGAIHPINLGANPRLAMAAFLLNAVVFVILAALSARQMLQGNFDRATGLLGSGGASAFLGYEIWRRSRRARGFERAAPAGREVRWVVSPEGLVRVDRRKAFRAPAVKAHPAAQVCRIVGEASEVTVRADDGTRTTRGAALLTAWTWKPGPDGTPIDLVPTSLYTLDGMAPGGTAGEQARALAAVLEAAVGVPMEPMHRALPDVPLSTPRARLNFLKAVFVAGSFSTAILLMTIGVKPRGVGLVFVMATVLAVPSTIYWGSIGALVLARRRWVRRRSGAGRSRTS